MSPSIINTTFYRNFTPLFRSWEFKAPVALSVEDKELERVKFAAPGGSITSSDSLAGK
jgi:hypothetical protein